MIRKNITAFVLSVFAFIVVIQFPSSPEKPYTLTLNSIDYDPFTVPKNLEQLAAACDAIVLATVLSNSDSDPFGAVVLQTDAALKGTVEPIIYQYDDQRVKPLQEGVTYLLFFGKSQPTFSPDPAYTLIFKNAVYQVSPVNRLVALSQQGEELQQAVPKSLSAFLDWLYAIPGVAPGTITPDVATFSTLEAAFSAADLVACVRVIDPKPQNDHATAAYLHFETVLKGDHPAKAHLYFFPFRTTITEGEAYLLFLKQLPDGSYALLYRSGAMIPETDTESWNKLQELSSQS